MRRCAITVGLLVCFAGCDEPDEKKARYVRVYLSQDVEINELLLDLDMKNPTSFFACI